MSEKKVSPYTILAIQTYRKMARMQRRLREIEVELNGWVVLIPEKDMNHYIEATDRIQEQQDEKLETFMARLGKQPYER